MTGKIATFARKSFWAIHVRSRMLLLAALSVSPTLAQSGSIVGWGSQVVVPPDQLENLTAIAAGGGRSLSLKADGSIVAWGDNFYGQCNVPVPNTGFVAGRYHSLGIRSNAPVYSPADLNCDGVVNNFDIDLFIECMQSGGCP